MRIQINTKALIVEFVSHLRVAAILILLLITESSFDQSLQRTKVVKIKGYNDVHTITLESDSAIVTLSLQDVREELTRKKSKAKFNSRDIQRYFTETLSSISQDQDYIFKRDDIYGGGIIEQYTLRALVSKGRCTIFNKQTKEYVKKIKRTHYKYNMAGELHEGYQFAFINGTIFFVDIIWI